MRILSYLSIITVLLFLSCTKDKALEPVLEVQTCSDTVSFSNEIQPLITNTSCNVSGCHDANTASSGYVFDNYITISSNADLMLSAINHEAGLTPMPNGQPQLADSLIQLFDCWVQQGKLDN